MSNHKIYRIKLTDEERDVFRKIIKGKRGRMKIAAWKVQRANAMLKCDESEDGPAWPDERIAEAYGTTTRSMENWRQKAALEGLQSSGFQAGSGDGDIVVVIQPHQSWWLIALCHECSWDMNCFYGCWRRRFRASPVPDANLDAYISQFAETVPCDPFKSEAKVDEDPRISGQGVVPTSWRASFGRDRCHHSGRGRRCLR